MFLFFLLHTSADVVGCLQELRYDFEPLCESKMKEEQKPSRKEIEGQEKGVQTHQKTH